MYFNKSSVKRRQAKLRGRAQKYERRAFISGFKLLLVAALFLIVVMAGVGFGAFKGMLDDAPDVSTVNIKPKGFKSTIYYSQDGTEERSLSSANSNRIYVYYDDICDNLVNAFVAIEDQRFWEHNGIDPRGIGRALAEDLRTRSTAQGASTITQQLIKNQVFNAGLNETTIQSVRRKVQEQYLAIEVEKAYSKEDILEYYLNTIYLGQGVNGVEAASLTYFDKHASELDVAEAACIAAITQNPYKYNPHTKPEKNAERRKLVLDKMLELGYIDQKGYDKALIEDVYAEIELVNKKREETEEVIYSYFDDALIRQLVEDFKDLYGMSTEEAYEEVYTGGYSIYSTQDKQIQSIVNDVLNNPDYYPNTNVMLEYQLTLVDSNGNPENYSINNLKTYFQETQGIAGYNEFFPSEADARQAANTFMEAMIDQTGYSFYDEKFKTHLEPQSSMTVIEQGTGYVRAIFGGRGQKTDNLGFCRATTSMRQPGSCFKPLAAFLPLIDTTGCLATSYEDAPYAYANGTFIKNWYGGFRGYASLRLGIRDSMNIVAVKSITEATPEVAFEYLERLGFTTLVDSYTTDDGFVFSDITQSAALGGLTNGVTNLEITAAYAAIANMGVYVKPVYYDKVYDHDGNLVIDNTVISSRESRAMKETTAYQLIQGLKDVITAGTGTPARLNSSMPVAGKTGTTTHEYDLWFCGFTPYYAASIWRGYDINTKLGSSNVHKQMWAAVMNQINETKALDPSKDWAMPDGLTTVTLCQITNKLPIEGCPTSTDLCAVENVPSEHCTGHESVTICLDSHKVATNTCPNTQSFVVERDEDGRITLHGATFEYGQDILDTICDLHEAEPEWHINTSAGEGGSISPTAGADTGDSVVITIQPAQGYSIKAVMVDGQNVGAVSTFTFNDIQMDHTISATFVSNGGGANAPEPAAPAAPEPEPEPQPQPQPQQSETTTEQPASPPDEGTTN